MHKRRFFVLWASFVFISTLVVLLPWRASAAVTISAFGAQWQGNSVVVTWRTASELNNAGFNILRSTSANGTFTKVHNTPAQFGSISGASYSFTDSGVTPGTTYYYRLQSIDTSGKVDTYSQTVSAAPPATPTATTAPPTATRTRTPTATATNVPSAPTSTPVPPTATATAPPQFTPTRTRTLPPGVPSPTPAPPTPTVRVAYVAQPSATRASAPAVAAPTIAPPEPTRVAIAIKDTVSDEETETDQDIPGAPEDSNLHIKQLILGAMIVLMGVTGAGGLVLGMLAIYIAFRSK
jgi:hypothetical protein